MQSRSAGWHACWCWLACVVMCCGNNVFCLPPRCRRSCRSSHLQPHSETQRQGSACSSGTARRWSDSGSSLPPSRSARQPGSVRRSSCWQPPRACGRAWTGTPTGCWLPQRLRQQGRQLWRQRLRGQRRRAAVVARRREALCCTLATDGPHRAGRRACLGFDWW